MWLRIPLHCAISLGKSTAVAYSNFRSPRDYEFAMHAPRHIQELPVVGRRVICHSQLESLRQSEVQAPLSRRGSQETEP
jgi:hypothetical protein